MNQFNGTLPPQWSALSQLTLLMVFTNRLAGTLPPQWSNLTQLQQLHLHNNQLTGTLPSEWSGLSALQVFRVHINHLYGTVPREWQEGMRSLSLTGYACNATCSGTVGLDATCNANGGAASCLGMYLWYNCINTASLPPINDSNPWNWANSSQMYLGPQRRDCQQASQSQSVSVRSHSLSLSNNLSTSNPITTSAKATPSPTLTLTLPHTASGTETHTHQNLTFTTSTRTTPTDNSSTAALPFTRMSTNSHNILPTTHTVSTRRSNSIVHHHSVSRDTTSFTNRQTEQQPTDTACGAVAARACAVQCGRAVDEPAGGAVGCVRGGGVPTTSVCDKPSGTYSNYYGVTCNATTPNGHITELRLSSCTLKGTLPPSINALVSLRVLQLSSNKLNGSLPLNGDLT